jgi:hypothetical protein
VFTSLTWLGNEEVDAQTAHGIAMAVHQEKLHMAYVGEGGKNLWIATLASVLEPLKLESNAQIKIAPNNVPETEWRPALTSDGKLLHLVYEGRDAGTLWWSWFDGKSWVGNIRLPLPPRADQSVMQPALAFFDGSVHCIAAMAGSVAGYNLQSALVHSTFSPGSPMAASSWSDWTGVSNVPYGYGDNAFQAPALAQIGTQLVMAATVEPSIGAGPIQLNVQGPLPTTWAPQKLTLDYTVSASTGLAIAPWSDSGGVLVVYYHSSALYYLYFNTSAFIPKPLGFDDTTLEPYQGPVQIKTPNSIPKTSAPLSIASFDGRYVIAYKGENSNDFYMAYATIPEPAKEVGPPKH